MAECKHKIVYGGIKYRNSKINIPGSGAVRRHYFYWFFCEKGCGFKLFEKLDFQNSSYDNVAFGATPVSSSDLPKLKAGYFGG